MLACVFDLDGTLLDTIADIAAACNHVLRKHGHAQHGLPEYKLMVGNGFTTLIKRAFEPKILNDEELAAYVGEARRWYGEHMLDNTVPYAGLTPALKKLDDAGILLGVLSNKPDVFTVELIERFFPDVTFAFILGSREQYPLKPDPSVLLEQLKRFRQSPANTFYIGDTAIDAHTAKNAGCIPVGVTWGFRNREELAQAGASIILDSPSELAYLPDKYGAYSK